MVPSEPRRGRPRRGGPRSAVGEHPVGQPEDDDRSHARRRPAGRAGPPTADRPSSAPVAGSRRTNAPSSGTSTVGRPPASLPLRSGRGQARARARPSAARRWRRPARSAARPTRTQGESRRPRRPATSARRHRQRAASTVPSRRREACTSPSTSTTSASAVGAEQARLGRRPVSATSRLQCGVAGEPVEQPQLRARRVPSQRCSTATPALPAAVAEQPAAGRRGVPPADVVTGGVEGHHAGRAARQHDPVGGGQGGVGAEQDVAGPGPDAGAGVQRDRLVAAVGGARTRRPRRRRSRSAPHIRALLRV